MKQVFFLCTLLMSSMIFSQENKMTNTSSSNTSSFNLGLKAQFGKIGFFGIEGEYLLEKPLFINSVLLSAGASAAKLKTDYGTISGTGFEVGLGVRKYLNEKSLSKGLYADFGMNYGTVKFDDELKFNYGYFKANGKYNYLSIANVSVGYKFQIKKFFIEPSVSGRYNIELKPTGFVENKDFDNILANGNIKIGYSF